MARKSHSQVGNNRYLPLSAPPRAWQSKSRFLKWGFLLLAAALLVVLTTVGPAHAQTTQLITLTATANGPTQIDLSWNTPSTAASRFITGYQIETSQSGADGTWTDLVADTASTGTTYSHTSVTAGETRYYRISGAWFRGVTPNLIDDANEGSLVSNVASATTEAPTLAPGAPTGLTATAYGQTRIDLSWTAPTGEAVNAAAGYKIEVSPSGGDGTWTTLESDTASTATTYAHLGLTTGNTRHYRVSAINAVGEGTPSAEASATTEAAGALTVAALPGALKVSWGRSGLVSFRHYDLYWEPVTRVVVELVNQDITSYTIAGLTPGTTYIVRFQVNGSEGVATQTYASGTPLLGKVAGVTATAASTTSVQVGWNAIAGAERYVVQWKSGAQEWSTERQITATGTSIAIPYLAPSTAYTIRVQARLTGISSGEWSEDATATTNTPTTAPGKPTGLTATGSGPLQIDLSWTAPAETSESVVTGYKIESSPTGAANTGLRWWPTPAAEPPRTAIPVSRKARRDTTGCPPSTQSARAPRLTRPAPRPSPTPPRCQARQPD